MRRAVLGLWRGRRDAAARPRHSAQDLVPTWTLIGIIGLALLAATAAHLLARHRRLLPGALLGIGSGFMCSSCCQSRRSPNGSRAGADLRLHSLIARSRGPRWQIPPRLAALLGGLAAA